MHLHVVLDHLALTSQCPSDDNIQLAFQSVRRAGCSADPLGQGKGGIGSQKVLRSCLGSERIF